MRVSTPPIGSLSSQPCSPSTLQEKATSVLLQVFFRSAPPKHSTSPALHPSESIKNHWVLTTTHHTSAKRSQSVCSFPSLHTACAEGEELSFGVQQQKFPVLSVSPEGIISPSLPLGADKR